jgi:hypothetical protein
MFGVLKGSTQCAVLNWRFGLPRYSWVFSMIAEEVQPPDAVPSAESGVSQPKVSPKEDPDRIRGEVFKRMFPDVSRKPSE